MEWVEPYLEFIELLLTLVIPFLVGLTIFSWSLAIRAWPYKTPTVIAISNSIIGAAATWVVVAIVYNEQIGPVPPEFLAGTATSVFILCTVPSTLTVYLAWLEVKGWRRGLRDGDRDGDPAP